MGIFESIRVRFPFIFDTNRCENAKKTGKAEEENWLVRHQKGELKENHSFDMLVEKKTCHHNILWWRKSFSAFLCILFYFFLSVEFNWPFKRHTHTQTQSIHLFQWHTKSVGINVEHWNRFKAQSRKMIECPLFSSLFVDYFVTIKSI